MLNTIISLSAAFCIGYFVGVGKVSKILKNENPDEVLKAKAYIQNVGGKYEYAEDMLMKTCEKIQSKINNKNETV